MPDSHRVYSYSAVLMGSPILLKLFSHDEALASRVFRLIKQYEDLLTVNRAHSQVMDVNHAAGQHPVVVSRPVFDLIRCAKAASLLKDSAFNLAIGPLVLATSHLWVITATVLLAGVLAAFFRHTRTGLALRACSEDARSAALMGIPVARMHTLAWALGAALAAIAGLLLAPITFVHLNMGFIALKAFPAAVLGGLTSLPGALVAGVFLGVAEALAGLALPEGAKDFVPYVLLMAALLLFPQGLGGGRGRA